MHRVQLQFTCNQFDMIDRSVAIDIMHYHL